jgi:hypothetical protein
MEQLAAAQDQAHTEFGETATYRRADTGAEVAVTPIVSVPRYQVEDGGVILAVDHRNFLIRTSELVFATVAYEPRPGDLVRYTMNGQTMTCAVAVEDNRQYCWTWADHHHLRRRIFTKLIAVA